MTLSILIRLTLILLGFCHTELGAAPGPSSEAAEASAPEITYVFRDVDPPVIPVQTRPLISSQAVLVIVLFVVAAFPIGKIVLRLNARFKFWTPVRAPAADRSEALLAEEPALGAFFVELRDGLAAPAPEPAAKAAADPLQEFFESAPGRIAELRTLFSEISRGSDEAARKKTLLEFLDQVRRLKEGSQMLELRPVWVMACALEGLLKQLSSNASNVTPSVLATAAGAVDLLEALCVQGLNPHLASDPPVRLLAVDDDAVSRLAISFALKKAFNEPDLAPDGEAALALAALQTYDVIFLDVEMPGMDGFELCTKIRGAGLNRTTPVVFVTRHNDFASRAKSSLSGGCDLIGKPFLAFEITVKAFTLALRARLVNDAPKPVSANNEASAGTAPVTTAIASEAPTAIAPAVQPAPVAAPSGEEVSARTAEQKPADGEATILKASEPNALPSAIQSSSHSSPAGNTSPELNDRTFAALLQASQNDFITAFFIHAPAYLENLRSRLEAARSAAEPDALQKFLGELYVGVHSLSLEADRGELRAVFKLGSALEGMLKKLLEQPNLCTLSTLNAAASALELLDDLCQAAANPDLANPPLRLLVVDDDPVARRAISGSLQLAFGKPDTAESGEAALKLAAENPFDLIFLDVLMPGIDGFTTCTRIHQTAPNRGTPVVFITSHNDRESRSQAAVSGGCGFLPKPVLASQIKLMALTFTLRARLNKPEPTPAREEAPCLEMA